jgi:hypothetical protein
MGGRSVPSITRAPVKAIVDPGCCAGAVTDQSAAVAQAIKKQFDLMATL